MSENRGPGELIPLEWLRRSLDERDMTPEERTRFQDGLDEAMRALHSDAVAQEIVETCTLHGTSSCEGYHERIDQMAGALLNGGEAGVSNFEHTGSSPFTIASTPVALPNGGGSRYSIVFSEGELNDPTTVAHEIAHWYLTENGVPLDTFESTLGSPDRGSLQHDVTNTIACVMDPNQCGQDSGGSRTRSTEPEEPPKSEPETPEPEKKKDGSEYCAPDQEDCGCSAMSQAFAAMVECERSRIEEKFKENAPPPPGSDPIGPVTYPEPDSSEPIMSKRGAAAVECIRFFMSRAYTPPAPVRSTTLDYCDDPEVDPCRCYGCGGSALAPSHRCGDVECAEGYHCGPLSGRCERDMNLGDDSPRPSVPEGD